MTDQNLSQSSRLALMPLSPTMVKQLSSSADFNAAAHGLRGIASLMVMVAHILGGTARHIYSADAAYTGAIAHPWNFGVFGVKLFFLISGFVILPSAIKYPLLEFAARRLLRIYPLFFASSILFIVINAFTGLYPALNTAGTVISGLLFINLFTGTEQLAPNAWSLSYEVAYYVLTALCVWVIMRRAPVLVSASVAILSLAFLIAFPVTLFFIFGCLIRLIGSRMINSAGLLRIIEALAFIGLVFSASAGFFVYTLSQLTDPTAICALCCAVAFFWLAVDPRSTSSLLFSNRIWAYFGTISYSMYMVHPYVYFLVRDAFKRLHLFTPDAWQSVIAFGVVVAFISTAASQISNKWLEQWPYRRIFHQRVFHSRVEPPLKRTIEEGIK